MKQWVKILLLFIVAFVSITLPTLIFLVLGLSGFRVPILTIFLISVIYIIFLIPLWMKMASWATRIYPDSNAIPISKIELENRLLNVSRLKLPFTITKEGKYIIAQWNLVDRKVIETFSARRIKRFHKIKMRLTDKNEVLAVDIEGNLDYGFEIGNASNVNFNASFFRGIKLFQYNNEKEYGLIIKDNKIKVDKVYEYKLNLQEMKNPIIDIITKSGWVYQPVVSFLPFLH